MELNKSESQGFNPCFGGSYIMTYKIICNKYIEFCFNPCFGGSYIMTTDITNFGSETYRFQSLFWWILYYDLLSTVYQNIVYPVSILVLVDLIL